MRTVVARPFGRRKRPSEKKPFSPSGPRWLNVSSAMGLPFTLIVTGTFVARFGLGGAMIRIS